MKKRKLKAVKSNCGGKKRGCCLKSFDLMKGRTFETMKQAA